MEGIAIAAPDDVRAIFDEYVFGFIENDIRREIWLADQTELTKRADLPAGRFGGAGNVLAALGLMAYTEYLGSFISGRKGRGWSRANFAWGYRKLGQPYRDLVGEGGIDVYNTFRNGLVHEYVTKRNCTIYMRFEGARAATALGRLPDGAYYFVVEAYLGDLMRVAERIYDSPMARMPQDGPEPTVAERSHALTSDDDTGLVP